MSFIDGDKAAAEAYLKNLLGPGFLEALGVVPELRTAIVLAMVGFAAKQHGEKLRELRHEIQNGSTDAPLSAWEKYRPDDLTDDELAALDELSEEVIKSKGILIP